MTLYLLISGSSEVLTYDINSASQDTIGSADESLNSTIDDIATSFGIDLTSRK